MSYTKPTIEQFKMFFARDFPFAQDPLNPNLDTEISDADINRAMVEADCFFNSKLFCDQDCFTLGYDYLTAHFLTENIRNSSQGISGQFEGILSSKSVSSVSASYGFPSTLMEDPSYAFLLKTTYGAKYLELIYPMLKANVFTVAGATLP